MKLPWQLARQKSFQWGPYFGREIETEWLVEERFLVEKFLDRKDTETDSSFQDRSRLEYAGLSYLTRRTRGLAVLGFGKKNTFLFLLLGCRSGFCTAHDNRQNFGFGFSFRSSKSWANLVDLVFCYDFRTVQSLLTVDSR